MNAAAAYGLSRSLRIDHLAALCIGCCWSLSQFMWANIENINAFYAWPGLIALALQFNLSENIPYGPPIGDMLLPWELARCSPYNFFASIYLLLFSCILLVSILIYHGIHRKKIMRLLQPLLITCIVFLCGFAVYAFQRPQFLTTFLMLII